jgi:hypothetical protein
VLKRIFGPKRDVVTGLQRKLHEKLHLYTLHSTPNIISEIKSKRRWDGHMAGTGERKGSYRVLLGKQTTWKT